MNKKIRLLQITHDLAIGGLQQVIVNICRTINRDQYDISVLCLRALGEYALELEALGIKVFLLPQKEHGTDYLTFLKVAKVIKQQKIDVIHTHNTQPFVDGTIAAILTGVKVVVHTDHARSFPDKWRYMFAEWLMSKYAYKVVGVSEHTSNNLKKYEKISTKKIVTIPNGVDETKYEAKIDKAEKRKELGLRSSGPIIGLCVRLTEQKGITYLLNAMPAVVEKFPDITLVIAGKGNLDEKLREEAKVLGVDKNVMFIGPRLDIPELLKLFDVYVLPSLWEGLPMVLIEAMAAGCPVIATNVGGNYMAIKDGYNGILVEPKKPNALSVAIITLLNDRDLAVSYSNKGRDQFEQHFSASTMTEAYQRLYEKALILNGY